MIDHTGLQVSDPQASRLFYDNALKSIGYRVITEVPKEFTSGTVVLGYGAPPKADFWVAKGKDNGAFVLDPDGHNIEAVCHKPE